MADPAKYKSLSVPRKDWEQLENLQRKPIELDQR